MPLEAAATVVDEDGVTFRYVDETGEVSGVSLVQEVAIPRAGPDFVPLGKGAWEVRFARPEVDRFEYRFELRWPGPGRRDLILDPDNTKTAPGAFGLRSVIEFPEYEAPGWFDSEPPRGEVTELDIPSARLGGAQPCLLWSSHGSKPNARLPLLVALDGVEFERFSGLLRFLDAMTDMHAIPPMRALLMHPTRRDDHYSANPAFPAALEEEIVPAVNDVAPVRSGESNLAGLGASLGGLALIHAHRRMKVGFGALFLQSSTFLHHGYLLGFAHYRRVERFLSEILDGTGGGDNASIELTCGSVEFSLENNRAVARSLRRRGDSVGMHTLRDAHNWIAWRDAWDPHLVTLLQENFG